MFAGVKHGEDPKEDTDDGADFQNELVSVGTSEGRRDAGSATYSLGVTGPLGTAMFEVVIVNPWGGGYLLSV